MRNFSIFESTLETHFTNLFFRNDTNCNLGKRLQHRESSFKKKNICILVGIISLYSGLLIVSGITHTLKKYGRSKC